VNSSARKAEIESEARKLTSGSWTQGNLITFNKDEFVSKLQQADPLLREVSVKRKWFHGVIVTATLKQPSLGWSTGNQIYVLDKDGTVIGVAAGSVSFPVVYDGSNLPVAVGQRVASVHFVDFVSSIVPALAASGITVTRLDIKDTTFDLAAQTNKGYRLLFDTSRGAAEEVGGSERRTAAPGDSEANTGGVHRSSDRRQGLLQIALPYLLVRFLSAHQ